MKRSANGILSVLFLFIGFAWANAQILEDIDVPYDTRARNKLDVYYKASFTNAPIIVGIHGGGWQSGTKANIPQKGRKELFLNLGYILVSVDYTLSGDAEYTGFPMQPLEIAKAIGYMQDNAAQYGGDPSRIVLTGISAGAHLSSLLAYNNERDYLAEAGLPGRSLNVIGWIGADGPYDFDSISHRTSIPKMLGPELDEPALWSVAEPMNFISADDVPGLILASEDDVVVTLANSVNLADEMAVKGIDYSIITVPGSHTTSWDILGFSKVENAVTSFLQDLYNYSYINYTVP